MLHLSRIGSYHRVGYVLRTRAHPQKNEILTFTIKIHSKKLFKFERIFTIYFTFPSKNCTEKLCPKIFEILSLHVPPHTFDGSEIRLTSWYVRSSSHYLQGFLDVPDGFQTPDFWLNHQQDIMSSPPWDNNIRIRCGVNQLPIRLGGIGTCKPHGSNGWCFSRDVPVEFVRINGLTWVVTSIW